MTDETLPGADQVAAYLRRHPEFFQDRPDLLELMRLPDPRGPAVSLLERQASILRDRNQELRERLNGLIDVARENDLLFEHTRRLTLALLEARSTDKLLRQLLRGLEDEFRCDTVSLLLHDREAKLLGEVRKQVRFMDPDDLPSALGRCCAPARRCAASCARRSWKRCSRTRLKGEIRRRGAPGTQRPPGRAGHRQRRRHALPQLPGHPVHHPHRPGAQPPAGGSERPRRRPPRATRLTAVDSRQAAIDAFVRHLASERRLSPHTVKHYRRDLSTAAEALDLDWAAVTAHDVRALVARLHRRGLGGRSLQRLLSSLRTFYTWLIRERRATDNPALDVRAPQSGRRLPKALDADQARALLDHPDGDGPWRAATRPCWSCSTAAACGWRSCWGWIWTVFPPVPRSWWSPARATRPGFCRWASRP